MGFRIWSLCNLPMNNKLNLFIFVLGDSHWSEGPSAVIEENFNALAKQIGHNAAIVVGHDGDILRHELATALERKASQYSSGQPRWPDLHRFIAESHSNVPSILIIGNHPTELDEKDLVLYSSLDRIKVSFGSMDQFFVSLCDFAKTRNSQFLKFFQEKSRLTNAAELMELKPNFCGIGININEMFRRLS